MSHQEQISISSSMLMALLGEISVLQQGLDCLNVTVRSMEIAPALLDAPLSQLAALQSQASCLGARMAELYPGLADAIETVQNSAAPSSVVPHVPAELPLFSNILERPITLAGGGMSLPTNGLTLSGQYLLTIDTGSATTLARSTADTPLLQLVHQHKQRSREASLGLVDGYNEDYLIDARWAVIVHTNEPAQILHALTPLLMYRASEQEIAFDPGLLSFRSGETCGQWYGRVIGNTQKHREHWLTLPPVLIYRGDKSDRDRTVRGWLARHGTIIGPVDPRRGVPFYLMIAARPGPLHADDDVYIDYAFQYELDLFWGVGRLCFTHLNGQHDYAAYTQYAEQVIAFERNRGAAAARLRHEIAYVATRHEDDLSTQLSADELVLPMYRTSLEALQAGKPLALTPRLYLADGHQPAGGDLVSGKADKATLHALLHQGRPPALLFAASHGIGMPGASNHDILRLQGALVTQDGGPHCTNSEQYSLFSASDIDDSAAVTGMIVFLLACYGAGSPMIDEFVFKPQSERPLVAPFPFVACLPQALLRRGALAVISHVDRAWTYTFRGLDLVQSQPQSFRDVIGRLAAGKRAGYATDQFNVLQAGFGLMFGKELEDLNFGKQIDPQLLARLWMARNDARNYALLGDPAVRLPFR